MFVLQYQQTREQVRYFFITSLQTSAAWSWSSEFSSIFTSTPQLRSWRPSPCNMVSHTTDSCEGVISGKFGLGGWDGIF